MTRTRILLVAAAGLLAAFLSGCAPTIRLTGEPPLIAVLNAPSQNRLEGSAERLERDMRTFGPLPFDFVNEQAMRFQEGHNDFFHSRAADSAARVARSYGAPFAVMIGAPVLDRQVVVSKDQRSRQVTITLQMQATVVDAADGVVRSDLYARQRSTTRVESNDQRIVALAEDADVAKLRDAGIDDLAPAVVGALTGAVGDAHATGSNGG